MNTLKAILHGDNIAKFIGAHDGMGAHLAQKAGFDGLWASGLEIATASALPDANILSMNQFLDASKSMRRASQIPILADCDTGFGNSNNVIHTVREYESAGIEGICIEDKTFPKTNSFIGHGQTLAPVAEFVGKILAGKNGQTTDDFVLVARVEALIAGMGQEEALKRAHAYADAGADAILMHSKSSSPDEIMTFLKSWKKRAPIILVPTTYPSLDLNAAKDLGCRLVIYANHGLRAAVTAMENTFRQILSDGHTEDIESDIATLKTIFEIQGMPQLKELETRYSANNFEIPAIILSAGEKKGDNSLQPLLSDRPLGMLDVGGKSLLEFQSQIFNRAGCGKLHVVIGHMADQVRLKDANLYENKNFKSTGPCISAITCPLDKGPVLLSYGDIVIHDELIKKLAHVEEDIAVLLDQESKPRYSDKSVQRAFTKGLPKKERDIDLQTLVNITSLDSAQSEDEEACELIGLVKFSEKGWQAFRKLSSSLNPTATLIDSLQGLIHQGFQIKGLVTNRGWSEIHTYEDFKNLSSHLKDF